MSRVEILLTLLVVTALVGGAVYLGRLDARVAALEKSAELVTFKRDRDAALALIDKAASDAVSTIEEVKGSNPQLHELGSRVKVIEAYIAKRPDEKLSDQVSRLDGRLANLEGFLTKKRTPLPEPISPPGPGLWGTWHGPAFCPDNHYVCGIEQKVEPQQGNGDDTAMNAVRVYCCPL
jgi:hypothetical protein